MHYNRFPKSQRLCSNKSIEQLFAGGGTAKSLAVFPLRAVWIPSSHIPQPSSILVSVSKRRLKHAVDRNRTKRQIREAWRNNRDILEDVTGINIGFLWLSDTVQPTPLVVRKMRNLLHNISEKTRTETTQTTPCVK